MNKLKYRVMLLIPKEKCGSCGPDEWYNIDTTYDPKGYKLSHPDWIMKFEPAILSNGVRIVG